MGQKPKTPKRFAWITAALEERKHLQRDLAKAWGIDDAVVTRFIATGKPDLTPERMRPLARMVGMDYNELMARMYPDDTGTQDTSVPVPKPSSIERTIGEIQELLARLRQLLPGARINFSIEYGE